MFCKVLRGMIATLTLIFCLTALAEAADDPTGGDPIGGDPIGAVIATPSPRPWMAPDAAVTDEQVGALLEGAELSEGERAEDYFVLPEGMTTQSEGAFTLLIVGTDAYTVDEVGRSDTMMLAHVSLETGEVRLISFLRDMYVKIPGRGRHRLNASYMYGGVELLGETLAQNFGVRYDRYLSLNFSLMVELIDQIGGVEVEVSEAERKQLNSILKYYNKESGCAQGDGLLTESGAVRLSGKQALSFSRIRKIDSDFKRTERQRKVLRGVLERLRALDATTLAGLIAQNIGKVETDVSPADALALAPLVAKMDGARLEGMSVPLSNACQDETINGMMVLVPNLKKNATAIADFLAD